jgi:hypothetical protein
VSTTSCNPGRWLTFEAELELVEVDGLVPLVVDRESTESVTLAGLLLSFVDDLSENYVGPVRITIEPLDELP